MPRSSSLFFLIWLTAALAVGAESFSPEQIEFFQKSVEPILVENCHKCHGGAAPDAHGKVKLKGNFQLISRAGILKGGDHGPAFDPKNSAKSLLLRVISYEDEHLKMPPRGKLPPDELATLAKWVEMGLPWTPGEENRLVEPADESGAVKEGPDNSWTYDPLPKTPITPPASNLHPVDAFLDATLTAKKLAPAPPASRQALIRRAYYDLTGLPPSPEQVRQFQEDSDPQAWRKVIDQLLASRHYGEKYARHWLDLVRYAETNGFERDGFKEHIWRYRQYVIDSFNADKPFDRFALEQIAGDECEDVTPDSLIATGFWRLMQWDDEPADPLQHAYDVMDDNVRTTSELFLGVSIGCARCHNHKTDPISQKDYFSFMAFIHGVTPFSNGGSVRDVNNPNTPPREFDRKGRPVFTLAQKNERKKLLTQISDFHQEVLRRLRAKSLVSAEAGKVLVADSRATPTKWHYTFEEPDASWPNPGYSPESNGWKEGEGGFGSPGPTRVPRTKWNSSQIWLRTAFQLTEIPTSLTLTVQHDEDAEIYLNGQLVKQLRNHIDDYIDVPLGDVANKLQTGKNILAIHVIQSAGGQYIDAGLRIGGEEELATLVAKHGQEVCTPDEIAAYKAAAAALEKLDNPKPRDNQVLAQIVTEGGPKPADLHVHIRGNPHSKGEKVEPAFPAVFKSAAPQITPLERSSGRRLALAKWIASPDNPRTARVIVNRLWQWHFGRGLIPSTSEFGRQGVACSHPELLDYLAQQLIAKNWSLKEMHRLIMTSAAYQRSSQAVAASLAADPANQFWWRFDMRRLSSEEVRDSLLMVAGNINLAYGGESFFVEMPDEVLATASRGKGAWGKSPPAEERRRSIYMKQKRSLQHPLMTDFDQADTDSACPVRFTTTVPGQALNFLNSKFLSDQAIALAARLAKEAGPDLKAQLRLGWALVTQRPAQPTEIDRLVAFADELREKHGLDDSQTRQRLCLVLLNLNEFLFLD